MYLFSCFIWVSLQKYRWGMEETALKSVLWVENSRMELQIPPLWRGSGLPRTSTLVMVSGLNYCFSLSSQSRLNLYFYFGSFWVLFFMLGHSLCFSMFPDRSPWLHGTLVLNTNPNSSSIQCMHQCHRIWSWSEQMKNELERRDIYIYILHVHLKKTCSGIWSQIYCVEEGGRWGSGPLHGCVKYLYLGTATGVTLNSTL